MIRKKVGIQSHKELKKIPQEQVIDVSQIKGIGIKTTEKILKKFGTTSLKKIQRLSPKKLREAGLREKQIANILGLLK